MLKCIKMNITVLGANWIHLAEVRNKWRTLLKLEMKLAFHIVTKFIRCLKMQFIKRVCVNLLLLLNRL